MGAQTQIIGAKPLKWKKRGPKSGGRIKKLLLGKLLKKKGGISPVLPNQKASHFPNPILGEIFKISRN